MWNDLPTFYCQTSEDILLAYMSIIKIFSSRFYLKHVTALYSVKLEYKKCYSFRQHPVQIAFMFQSRTLYQ